MPIKDQILQRVSKFGMPKMTVPSEHTHLVSSVNSVFHQMFAKSQKKQKKALLALYKRFFWQNLVKISFGKVSVAPTKMDLTDSAQRDRSMTTVTQIRMTLFLVWLLLVAPGINLPIDGIDGKCEDYAVTTIIIVLMLLVAPDLVY